jgi:hypothetical protein
MTTHVALYFADMIARDFRRNNWTRFWKAEAIGLKIKLKESLLKFTLDGSIIEVGSEFEVAETFDDWTFPDNPIPMYIILEGEYAGKFLHRFYCKVI